MDSQAQTLSSELAESSQRRLSNQQSKYKLTYSVGVSETMNNKYRPTMEDVHTYVENFVERLDWGYFAIFDGHAGKQAAKWCGQHLHSIVERRIIENESEDVRNILNESFIETDSEIVGEVKGSSGCTAAVAVIRWELPDQALNTTASQKNTPTNPGLEGHKRMLYTANVGDTRIILFRDGKAIRLTYDHKATDKNEVERIEQKGGLVMKSRVNGMLAVTRSLGDKFFKDLVIGNPYTTSIELDSTRDKFMIIACDGLWDVISDQKACELIQNITDANAAAQTLVKYALDHFTTDNVTVSKSLAVAAAAAAAAAAVAVVAAAAQPAAFSVFPVGCLLSFAPVAFHKHPSLSLSQKFSSYLVESSTGLMRHRIASLSH
ncbi:hypothetical protein WICPIJ_008070 [Wickerhamomyces pijperi]|uniref:PPM-type phosphatase domain-containing protein n=1 Tax=Wickerhamomyces pijperi TaxID=599730 RepID=A0A9P8PZ55_WICPI|nr:hypothetical protein WICPIJ_008070 [Wickerhamomyces pijperi]